MGLGKMSGERRGGEGEMWLEFKIKTKKIKKRGGRGQTARSSFSILELMTTEN